VVVFIFDGATGAAGVFSDLVLGVLAAGVLSMSDFLETAMECPR